MTALPRDFDNMNFAPFDLELTPSSSCVSLLSVPSVEDIRRRKTVRTERNAHCRWQSGCTENPAKRNSCPLDERIALPSRKKSNADFEDAARQRRTSLYPFSMKNDVFTLSSKNSFMMDRSSRSAPEPFRRELPKPQRGFRSRKELAKTLDGVLSLLDLDEILPGLNLASRD